jgi:hypothetical protein
MDVRKIVLVAFQFFAFLHHAISKQQFLFGSSPPHLRRAK